MFNKKKDTFTKENFPRRFKTQNISFHTKEFFIGAYPDYVPPVEPPRTEKTPDFNPANFNFMNFRVDIETPA
jgi:hypothetical protein